MAKQKGLLIAEKSSLMNAIQSVYKKTQNELPYSLDFCAQSGHLVQQVAPNEYCEDWGEKWDWAQLPMIPDNKGGWKYTVIPNSARAKPKDRYKQISDMLKKFSYDFIVHAGDPDREGEYLVRLVLEQMKCKLPVKRFWSNDLSDKAIIKELKGLRDDDNDPFFVNLTKAAYGRSKFDWLVGMNVTRAATLAMHGMTARCGRVKTPLLKIIVDRELAIANFKPVTTYGVLATYFEGFDGLLVDPDGDISFNTVADAAKFIECLDKTAIVKSVERKTESSYAPSFFRLSSLQVEADKIYGFNADKTVNLAQSLYEKKILSYPRTSCEYISSEMSKDFPELLNAVATFAPELAPYVKTVTVEDMKRVGSKSRYVNDEKLKEEGHTALIPTGEIPNVSLSADERNVLLLVFKRFLAAFLPPITTEKATIITQNNTSTFKSNCKMLKDKGYSVLYNTKFEDVAIPNVKEGQLVNVKSIEPKEKTSTCPKRFTEGDLIEIMENPVRFLVNQNLKSIFTSSHGIGTDATRANIIRELIKNGYIIKKKGKGKSEGIFATDEGIAIIKNISNRDIASVDLTAQWEEKLTKVERGELSLEAFYADTLKYVQKSIDDFKGSKMEYIAASVGSKGSGNKGLSSGEKLGVCPKCGSDIVKNKFGNYGCSNWKNGCKFSIFGSPAGKKLTETNVKDLLSKGKTREIKGFKSKQGKPFDAVVVMDQDGKTSFEFKDKRRK